MNGKPGPRTLLTICLSFVLISLLLPACSPASNGSTVIRGWVSSSVPVSSAYLIIYGTDGKTIYQSESPVTSEFGSFLFTINKRIPADFRVLIKQSLDTGPDNTNLMADIRGYDPVKDVIYVNLVTTIVSSYLDKNKSKKLEEAEGEVKSFLGIPGYMDIRTGDKGIEDYFFASAFLREASQNGGGTAYINQLVGEMADPGASRSFLRPAGLMTNAGGVPTAGILDSLASGAASYAGGQLMGWGLSLVGLDPGKDDPTTAALKEMQQTLKDIKDSIDKLDNKLSAFQKLFEKEISQTQYLTMMNYISDELKYTRGLHARLAALVAPDPASQDAAPSSTPAARTWTQDDIDEKNAIIQEIEDKLLTTKDAIHELLVGQTAGFEPLITVWTKVYKTQHRFLTSESYSDITDWYAYFEQMQVYLVELLVEYHHAKNHSQDKISGLINDVKSQIQEQQGLLPNQVPQGIFVDTSTGKMWMQKPIFNCTGAQYKTEGHIGPLDTDYWNDINRRDTDYLYSGGPLWFVYGGLQNYHQDQPNSGSPLNAQITYTNGEAGFPANTQINYLNGDVDAYFSPSPRNFGFNDWILPKQTDLLDLVGDYQGNHATEDWFVSNGAFPSGATLENIWGNSGGNVWTGEWYWSDGLAREVVNVVSIGVWGRTRSDGKPNSVVSAILKEGSAGVASLFPCRVVTPQERYY